MMSAEMPSLQNKPPYLRAMEPLLDFCSKNREVAAALAAATLAAGGFLLYRLFSRKKTKPDPPKSPETDVKPTQIKESIEEETLTSQQRHKKRVSMARSKALAAVAAPEERPPPPDEQLQDEAKDPVIYREGGCCFREATMDDMEAMYEVCLKTGQDGQDASDVFKDPRLLGNRYVGPYLTLEPSLAFVLEDKDGICGYVLGVLDSSRFYERLVKKWIPMMKRSYPYPTTDPSEWGPDEDLQSQFHAPEFFFTQVAQTNGTIKGVPKNFAKHYPSHFHIDLLPRVQRQGHGTRMMAHLMATLKERGSSGLHLEMTNNNKPAEAFYAKQGFQELIRTKWGLILGKRLQEERAG